MPPPNLLDAEISRFDALATRWWNPTGPMRVLHAMNPLRTEWIASRLPPGAAILDVGCGAGLAAEALARRGHPTLGLDAASDVIDAAWAHATGQDLPLRYRVGVVETLLAEEARFPAIIALEVIEHVLDPASFLRGLAGLLQPGGRVFVSTLNRTLASLAIAKIGAEYIAGLLPRGTHDWRRFVTPVELAAHGRATGLRLATMAGMRFDPLRGRWRESRDLSMNYIAMLARG